MNQETRHMERCCMSLHDALLQEDQGIESC